MCRSMCMSKFVQSCTIKLSAEFGSSNSWVCLTGLPDAFPGFSFADFTFVEASEFFTCLIFRSSPVSRSSSSPSTMALSLPGSSSLALVPAAGPATGRSKLDSRFAALLAQHNVPEAIWDRLGDVGVDNAPLFGNLSTKEETMHKFFKQVLKIDRDAVATRMID